MFLLNPSVDFWDDILSEREIHKIIKKKGKKQAAGPDSEPGPAPGPAKGPETALEPAPALVAPQEPFHLTPEQRQMLERNRQKVPYS